MALSPGTKLGPYEITAPLGAGGMGEVYLARDTRLDRDVAVKILPEHLRKPDLQARFEREAKAISGLQHPHICVLHDVGSQNGLDFLVMEYLEGETLADHLAKGALALDQILNIGIQIAEALDKAHRRGLVHRDLKPANIMLTKSGAKLMDFGLAKPAPIIGMGAAAGPLTPATPTMSVAAMVSPPSPITQKGEIVGTFHYMSPEVVQGAEADPRSDIFAFGAVLYEMVTGHRAFVGKSQLSVLTAILEKEPELITSARANVPDGLDYAIGKCLTKDPELRWQTTHDLALQLRWLSESGRPVTSAQRFPPRWMWAAAALLVIVSLAGGYFLRSPTPTRVLRANLTLPNALELENSDSALALSPNGRRLALVLIDNSGKQQIWLRSLDSLTAQALAGTEGATYPFWSPDSRFLGFFDDGLLKKMDISTGVIQNLCDARNGRGASWGTRDLIVFSPGPYSPLYSVPAAGGTQSRLTTLDARTKNESHRLPEFLPDGLHVLFHGGESAGGTLAKGAIYAVNVQSKKVSLVVKEDSAVRYAAPGYILFVRNRTLMAQRFEMRSLRTVGEAVPIAERLIFNTFRLTAPFSVSDSGILIYQSGSAIPQSQLTWFDFEGRKLGTVGDPTAIAGIFLSPDDKRMLAAVVDSATNQISLWMYDLARDIPDRFSFGNVDFDAPVWSPDSTNIAFRDRSGTMFLKSTENRTHQIELFADGKLNNPTAWSKDGKTLLYCTQSNQGFDMWSLQLGPRPEPQPFIVTDTSECNGVFSPDGKWFAYTAAETGRNELYLVSYPDRKLKRQLSSGGAEFPNWSGNGRLLAYVNAEQRLVFVDVEKSGQDLAVGKPKIAFRGAPMPGLPRQGTGIGGPVYITSEGKRILLPVAISGGSMSDLTVVTDWSIGLTN
jgi:eukaryotic-like serine/threonine-protein kinase